MPAGAIKDGMNELVIRSENVSTTILGIDVATHMTTAQDAEAPQQFVSSRFAVIPPARPDRRAASRQSENNGIVLSLVTGRAHRNNWGEAEDMT